MSVKVVSMQAGARHDLLGKSAIYSLASIVPVMTGLLITPSVTRLLGPTEYGVAATCLVVVQVLGLLATLGLPSAITRHGLIEDSGVSGAARLVFVAAVVAACLCVVASATSPWWARPTTGLTWRPGLVLAVFGGSSLSVVTAYQSLVRAQYRAWRFVGVTVIMSLAAQGAALAMVALRPQAEFYLAGLGAVYFVLAVALMWDVAAVRSSSNLVHHALRDDLISSMRLSLPTIPHGLALMLNGGMAVLIASATFGSHAAGQLQLILLLSGAPALALTALNNAWAPSVYSAGKGERGRLIQRTAPLVLALVSALSVGVALAAPLALKVLAPPAIIADAPVWIVPAAAAAALPAVAYLSNVHLLFVEGRSIPLAWLTPGSLLVASTLGWWVSRSIGLAGLALIPLCFYSLQAIGVGLIRRRISSEDWSERSLLPIAIPAAFALGGVAVLPYDGVAAVIRAIVAVIALMGGALLVIVVYWARGRAPAL